MMIVVQDDRYAMIEVEEEGMLTSIARNVSIVQDISFW